MRLLQGVFVCSLCLLVLLGGCRRNRPSLVDTNEAPETQLWYSPPDSTEYEYLVHMYWRGTDNDGTVERYIWTVLDTIVDPSQGQTWDPAGRLADFRTGRITSSTDSIFSFTAYKNVGGVGIKKNRQAFFVASIDDNGVIDPSPAAVEFVATIDELPQMRFIVYIDGQVLPYTHHGVPKDTVGMLKPFEISFSATTENGNVRGYQWFPLSTTITLPGAREWRPWTPCDDLDPGPERDACEARALQDTLRVLRNRDQVEIPSSVFRFAAKCIDDANAESPIDAGRFSEGVCQVVVNFDPDTAIDGVKNQYLKGGSIIERTIDFNDGVPDTVPYKSWVWLHYAAWDDTRDSIRCKTQINPDRCINFQIRYDRVSARLAGSIGSSGWVPRGAAHDSDTLSAADSNSVNIGSVEYTFSVRGIDENLRGDGTPAKVKVVGNYDPTLETLSLEDQDGNLMDISPGVVDTLAWNWWNPINVGDTIDVFDPDFPYYKRFNWRIRASGYDHALDPDGSGIKAWRYLIYDETGNLWPLARAGNTWVTGEALNSLNDVFELTFRYPGPFPPENTDHCGDTVFSNLPVFVNRDLRVVLRGRDTSPDEGEFDQYMFMATVAPGEKGRHNFAEKKLINSYPVSLFGRYTEERQFTFHFRMYRPAGPENIIAGTPACEAAP